MKGKIKTESGKQLSSSYSLCY